MNNKVTKEMINDLKNFQGFDVVSELESILVDKAIQKEIFEKKQKLRQEKFRHLLK